MHPLWITAIVFFSLFIALTILSWVFHPKYKRRRQLSASGENLQNRETQIVHIAVTPGTEFPVYQTSNGQPLHVMRLEPLYTPQAGQNVTPYLQQPYMQPPSYQEMPRAASSSTGQRSDDQKQQVEMNQFECNPGFQKNEDNPRKDAY